MGYSSMKKFTKHLINYIKEDIHHLAFILGEIGLSVYYYFLSVLAKDKPVNHFLV